MTNKINSQIDMDIMHTIFGNNKIQMAEFIKSFIETISIMLNDAVHAIEKKNKKRAIDCFHFIKGPIGSCGFTKLYKICEQAEEKIRHDDWIAASKCCRDIEKKIDQLQTEMKKKFSDCI